MKVLILKTLFICSSLVTAFSALAVDIAIEIDTAPANFTPGTSQTNAYTIRVSKEAGSADVDDISISSAFSTGTTSGVTWSCAATGASNCDAANGSGNISASLDLSGDGNDVVFTINNVTFDQDIFSNISLNASITDSGQTGGSSNSDGTSSNDTDIDAIIRSSSTDISISVTDNTGTYTPGTTTTYDVIVSNTGPSDAQNVTFSDVVPTGMTITSWSCSADPGSSCSSSGASNGNVNPTLDIDVNDEVDITINASYASSATALSLVYEVRANITDGNASDPNGPTPAVATDSNTRSPQADLDIAVDTQNPATTYIPGGTEVYEIVVTNNGPSDVAGITVVDNAGADFASINWTCSAQSGSSCGAGSGNTPINTTVDLDDGDSATFTVNVTFNSAATVDPLIYEVTATNPTGVSGAAAVNQKSLNRVVEANLAFSINDGETSYTPGTSGTFIAQLTNNGPSNVTGITVVDTNPSAFESISWTCATTLTNSACTAGPENVPISTTVDLAAGDTATFTINVDFDSSAVDNPLVYEITATNPTGVNGTSPVTATEDNDVLAREVNLSITKTGKAGTLVPFEPYSYSIVISNAGPSDLGAAVDNMGMPLEEGVRLVDALDGTLIDHPTECNFGNGEPCWKYCESDAGIENSTISPDSCPVGIEIAEGTGFLLDFPVRLSSGSSSEIVVYTSVSDSTGSDCDPSEPATNEVCNSASITLVETATTTNTGSAPLTDDYSNEIVIGTDLLVTKTDGLNSIAPGTGNSYEVVVRNDGFINVTGVSVTDVMPIFPAQSGGYDAGSISWVCETSDVDACCNTQSTACGFTNPTAPVVSDVLNATIDLAAQTEVKFTITGDVAEAATGVISNAATATLPNGIIEADPLNNTDITDLTSLNAISDVAVRKTLESATINAVDETITELEYRIEVENLGPSQALGVTVQDLLDSSALDTLNTASWSCSVTGVGSCDTPGPVNGAAVNTQVDLDVGSIAVFVVNVNTNSGAQGRVLNVVTATASGFDPISVNNSDSVEYALTGTAQLTINNDDARLTATPGLPTSYTIRVTNEGPDNVFGATIRNQFPPQLTDVNWTCDATSPIPGDLTVFQRSDQTAPGTHMLLSPDNSHVYVTSPDAGGVGSRLFIFNRNTTPGSNFGQFSFVDFVTQGDAGIDGIDLPQALAMDQTGSFLYVLSDIQGGSAGTVGIAIFKRNNNPLSPSFGQLTYLGIMTDSVPMTPEDMLLSADQDHVYVTGDGMISLYSRDIGTGLLTFEGMTAQADAGQMTQSVDGSQIYIADSLGSDVFAFARDIDDQSPGFGQLTNINSISDASISSVSDAVLSADNMNVYLSSTGTDRVVVLNRNINTGELSFASSYNDADLDFNATESLVGLSSINISPDGQHLFIGNPTESSVVVLSRNSQGLLNKDQNIAETGLEGVADVVVTSDGRQILTTAAGIAGRKTLMAFDRRQPDPLFAFMEAEIDGIDDVVDSGGVVDGLLGASAVVVSDDGEHVYAASLGDDAIAVFARDRTKGSVAATRREHLSFIASYTDGQGGFSDLLDVDSLTLTPDGKFLYAGSADQATLTVMARASDGTLTYVDSYTHTTNAIDGLLGISGMAIDSASRHLYVAGRFEASVAHYDIDTNTGELTLVSTVANGDVGVSGLGGARSVVVTPRGEHVIVASSIDDTAVVLERDAVTGEIQFLQRLVDVGDQPMDVAVSPDGEHVYMVAANDNRLSVLRRDTNPASATFGQLSRITSYVDGTGGFNHLQGARSVAVSSNGEKVYVGAEFDGAISVLDRDQNENSISFGQLALVEVRIDDVDGVEGLNQVYDVVVSKDSRHVYAVGFGDDALSSYVLGVGSACSSQGSGNIEDVVDVGSNGTLTYTVNATIRSNAIGTLLTEASIIPPDNFTVISPVDVCTTSADRTDDNCDQDSTTLVPITDLSISKTDNRLSAVAGEPIQYEIVVSNLGPSDARNKVNESVMVLDVLSDQFESVTWTCEAVGSGLLSFIESQNDGVNGVVGLQGVSALAIAPDLAGLGPHVLATSVVDNGLLVFSINPVTGALTQVLQSGDFVQATAGINLTGARDVLVIDNDIYVASQVDDSLVAFKAVDNTGLELQWVANFNFGNGVPGLNQAVAVTASDNGSHLYVAGANDNSVVVFSRDLVSGALTLASSVQQGVSGAAGLSGVNALSVSADGYSVYTSGPNQSEIGIYQRDLVNGTLTFSEVLDSGLAGTDLSQISAVEMAADDQQVYFSSAANNALYVFNRKTDVAPTDSSYGMLTLQQVLQQGADGVVGMLVPSDIQASGDGRHVYVTSEQSDAVVWFARDFISGNLTFGGLISDLVADVDGLNGAIAVAVDANGEFVYVAGSQDSAIAAFNRTSDSFCPAEGTDIIGSNLGTEVSPDYRGVPVDLAVNGSLIFTVNATVAADAAGQLVNEAGVFSCFEPITGPVAGCAGSDPMPGNNIDDDIDELNPTADLMISKSDGLSRFEGLLGATKVDGDVDHVYIAATQENGIGIFARESNLGEADFGELSFVNSVENGVDGVSGLLAVSDVLLSDDGITLYAAGSGDNSVVVFRRDLNTGELTFLEKHSSGVFGVVGIEGVSSLALSSDGAHLYANGPLTGSVAVFTVEQTAGVDQGRLNFQQNIQDGVGGVDGLTAVSDLAVSEDGKHLYATSVTENSVSVFLRNPNEASISFGNISFMAKYSNGIDGVAGIAGAAAVAMSDTNGSDFVYVLGSAEQALAVFARDTSTGELSFIEFKQNGTSGVSGLDDARDLIISQDQASLYVAGFAENAVVHFSRDIGTGILTFSEIISDGDALSLPGEFVDGLQGASGVFIPADDSQIYVASFGDSGVAVLDRDISGAPGQNGNLSFAQVLINGQGGVAPGTKVTYLIVVSNAGPSDVEKARIVDNFPPEFEQISYQCFPEGGAGCNTNVQLGNVDELADIPAGSRVEIRATGVIRSDASGVVINTATVSPPTDGTPVNDPDLSNNTATDDDTVLSPAANLVVTKDNGVTTSVPGSPVSYTITVANDAPLSGSNRPSDVFDVMVTDQVPESITDVVWTCEAFPQPGLLDDGDGNIGTNAFISYNDLDVHTDMVISNNGGFAYAIGQSAGQGTLLTYSRNQRTGELAEIQRLQNADIGVNALAGASALSLSPDQMHLYVVSADNDAISSYSVNPVSGELTYLDVLIDGLGGVNGLGGARDVLISADGRHVYVAGELDNAIAILNRNTISGLLSFNSLLTGVEGLSGIAALTFDSSGDYLLAVAEANNSIASFARNSGTGVLSPVDVLQDFEFAESILLQPRDIAVLDDTAFVASFGSHAVSAFSVDAAGSLTYLYAVRDGDTDITALQGPESLLFGATGGELYVASSTSESITLFDVVETQLDPLGIVYDSTLIPELDGVNGIIGDSNGTFFYALSDDLTIAVRQNGSECAAQGSGQLSDIVNIVSGGRVVYTLQGTVLSTATGDLSNTATALMPEQISETFPSDNSATDTDTLVPESDLSVTKTDGLTQIVAGSELIYDLSAFSTGPSSVIATVEDVLPIFPTEQAGFLSGSVIWTCANERIIQLNQEYAADAVNGLAGIDDLVISADSRFVYTANSTSNSVTVYSMDLSGALTLVQLLSEGDSVDGGTVTGLTEASGLALDQSGAFLYVTGEGANSLAVFSINAISGMLNYVETEVSGSDGVSGLFDPVDVVVSPDNTGVYVASPGSDAITVFSRDLSTGELTFVERIRDGFGTIVPESNVIIGVADLAMSPDGAYLYTVANQSDALSIFARDPVTQTLTFQSVIRSGAILGGTVPSLDGLESIVISPNGDFLYAAAGEANTVSRFARNALDGSLIFEDNIWDQTDPLNLSANSVTLTPDGSRMLITDNVSDSISLFERNGQDGTTTLTETLFNTRDDVNLMAAPNAVVTNGVQVLVASEQANALVALRLTASAQCLTANGTDDSVAAQLAMSPGSGAGVQVRAVVHPAARGTINNTAVVTLPVGSNELNIGNSSALDQTDIIVQTDVAVEKTGPSDAFAGETIEYLIRLTNAGPSDALGVTVSDVLDSNLSDVSWTCSATGRSQCDVVSGVGDVNSTVDVSVDGAIEIVVIANIDSSFIGNIDNTATAVVFENGFNTDTDLLNNESSISTAVTLSSDLTISKTNSRKDVVAGEPVTYVITVRNDGPSDAADSVVTDVMPVGLENVVWSCVADANSSCITNGKGDINDQVFIAPDEQLVYTVTADVDTAAVGSLTNTADVAVTAPATDPENANNSATDSDTILQVTDLSISMNAGIDPYDPASPLDLPYAIDVINNGPSDAQGVEVRLPFEQFLSATVTDDCVVDGNEFVCMIGTAEVNVPYALDIAYRVTSSQIASVDNTAEVLSSTKDPITSNNSVTTTTTLLSGIDVRVTKDNGIDEIEPGAQVQYLITIDNIGSVDAGDVVIDEQMPAGLINASWQCVSYDGAACLNVDEFNITGGAALPSGGRVEFILTATVDPQLADMSQTDITNTVTVSLMSGTDFNMSNNTASDTDDLIFYIFRDGFDGVTP
ncbi:beta-propeller fold lactonase family protein [Marinicella sp. W31]|uniref:beta-propeller fold lactonase family protein n=1 Tax=Marinicella sp. W31 TaxID=3023713 RepID=UPI003758074E